MTRTRITVACAVLAAGCGAADTGTNSNAAAAGAAWSAAATEPLPPRFGLGRAATPDHIAILDIDVSGDGRGLPTGSGSAAEGATLYAARCAVCHGPGGEGTPVGTRLVAADPHAFVDGDDYDAFFTRTIGNFWPYAPTIFDYVRRAMPADQPGSLSDDEVYALTAWLLWKNDIVAEDVRLDAETLPLVRMPARDRFVPDDRESSTRVR
jgi:S-disulfanyl-L-cysteine oxidoreductase SoxD